MNENWKYVVTEMVYLCIYQRDRNVSVCGDIGQGGPKSGNLKQFNESNLPPRLHLAEKSRETRGTFDQAVALKFFPDDLS